MGPTFKLLLVAMGIAAAAVIGVPLWRAERRRLRPLRATLAELEGLQKLAAVGSIAAAEYANRRAALAERLVASLESEAPPRLSGGYLGAAVVVLLPVCAVVLYSSIRAPSDVPMTATAGEAAETTAVPLTNHGGDMRSAIAKLAAKLREHPEDAEGWALLGRTYRAMQQYAQARDAFQHAVAAAPADHGYQQELGTAMTPMQPPTWASGSMSIAQHGDLEASPVPVANDIGSPVRVTINRTVE